METALVLGAGVGGLAAARALARAGRPVTVLEAEEEPGGCFRTLEQDGFRVELGPNTIQVSPELEALCADAGCAGDLVIASPDASKRYLVLDGRLVALPGSPPALLTSPVLGPLAKLRLATEPFRRRGKAGPEESVAAFFRRRLGRQALERLGDALVLGIFAGDPEELAVGHALPRIHALEREHGSLLGGLAAKRGAALRRLVGFARGTQELARRLAEGLDLRYGVSAVALRRTDGGFEVKSTSGERFEAARLVLCLPQAASLDLLASLAEKPLPEPLPEAPVAVVALGYAKRHVGHPLDGFGFLAPHGEGREVLGALFSSTLFPDRAPEDHCLLSAMVGGRRRPELVDLDDEELFALAEKELAELLDIAAPPVFRTVRRWRPGIPQPTAARAPLLTAVTALEAAHPGLTVLGNWLRGVGVPDCVAAGWGLE